MGPGNEVRIGDAQRNEALDRLGTLFADGYLSIGEFEQRTSQAASARTRGELEAILGDLPVAGNENQTARRLQPQVDLSELDRMMARKKRLNAALGALWLGALLVFFVGLFVLQVPYVWLAFPIAGVLTAVIYALSGISSDEEEVLDQIEDDQRTERAERLRVAHERRKQLGR
ncbi:MULTISPECIES: DUF1707 domain-containing protein [unclassified Corynebacterium]|uniref:DUF1707 SHOCT-like domain-containing protein n=1 Tax=unclassified Corynebacterium TaxID=2624378 RepID=UPI001EF41571|nr:DUF1707 domain-containing protein [Corynebacterium sp. ACRPZ]MCG7295245.1 DUF1707 domain-containing protein [Corynebacterium sp. ACRPY]